MDTFKKLKQFSELEKELFNENNFENNFIRYIESINNRNNDLLDKIDDLISKINYLEKNELVLKQTIKQINIEREELQEEIKNLTRQIEKKEKRLNKCSNCGESGHNAKTCSK